MGIQLRIEVDSYSDLISPGDLGYTEENWVLLEEDEKWNEIENYVTNNMFTFYFQEIKEPI